MIRSNLKHTTLRGVVWVSIISAVAIPASQYRNWILNKIDETAYLVGIYAIFLLFTELVSTFFLYGASTVTSYYLPKCKGTQEQADFVLTYILISSCFLVCFYIICFFYPNFLSWALRKELPSNLQALLLWMLPVIFMAKMAGFILPGLMAFRLMAVLGQIQTLVVCLWATVAFFFFPVTVQHCPVRWISAVYSAVMITVAGVGVGYIFKKIPLPRTFFLPEGFWKFSIPIHLNTITSFIYRCVDQIFVLAVVDINELGIYFVLVQISQLLTFVPRRIMAVTITTFSTLFHENSDEAIRIGYRKLTEMSVHLAFFSGVLLIGLSRPILMIFGEVYTNRLPQFLALIWISYLACLGSPNVTLITAIGKTMLLTTFNWVMVIIQLTTTALLFNYFEGHQKVWAVIIGKLCATIFIQLCLWWVVLFRITEFNKKIPKSWWIGLLGISSLSFLALQFNLMWYWSSVLMLLIAGIYKTLNHVSITQIVNEIKNKDKCP